MLRIAMMQSWLSLKPAEPAKYLPEMAKTNYEGVTANIKFDDKGDLQGGAITVYRVVKGNWEVLKTVGAQ